MTVEVKQLQLGPMANFVYLIADPEAKECAVVDPAWDAPQILRAIKESGWRLSRILVTHHHPDHVNAVGSVLQAVDVPVHIHRRDAHVLKPFQENLRESEGGEKLRVGNAEIELLHTPGHTEGSQCFLVSDRLLSGDTLFIGGCGRVDFADSDPEKMYRSLKKLSTLPDKTVLFPGHDYADAPSATLQSEKKSNPYLKMSSARSIDDFLALVGM